MYTSVEDLLNYNMQRTLQQNIEKDSTYLLLQGVRP